VSRLLDFLGEEGWPVNGVGECPDYLTFLVRKVGQLGKASVQTT
jgi:hypothetical protein